MNVLILEDEAGAAIRLQELLAEVAPGTRVIAVLETIREAVAWFKTNQEGDKQPDIILSDIQLGDGLSFEALRHVSVSIPVIFTTAYDMYALNAFKLNSIDYLLKPIDKQELKAALDKYNALQTTISADVFHVYSQLASRKNYKTRFLIQHVERLHTITVSDVAYIRADDKVVFLHTASGASHIIDESLDELEKVLDPGNFFRINRTYVTSLAAIEQISNHFKGRLKIKLRNSTDNDIFVSRARVANFKSWLDR